MSNIDIYCNCFVNKTNKFYQFNQKNLMCGAALYDDDVRAGLNNVLFDDVGDNISHLNKVFGQLTGLYWVWKNTNHEIVGTNTYRLFWNIDNLTVDKNTVYVPEPVGLSNYMRGTKIENISIYEHYRYNHGSIPWNLLYGICHTTNIKLTPQHIDALKLETMLTPYNMFICEKNLFDKICKIFFDILFQFYETYNGIVYSIQQYYKQDRLLDFLGERILHIIFSNVNYFLQNVKVVHLKVKEFTHD